MDQIPEGIHLDMVLETANIYAAKGSMEETAEFINTIQKKIINNSRWGTCYRTCRYYAEGYCRNDTISISSIAIEVNFYA